MKKNYGIACGAIAAALVLSLSVTGCFGSNKAKTDDAAKATVTEQKAEEKSADQKKAEEEKKAEEAKKAEEEKKAEEAKKAEEEKKAAEAKAAEEKKAEETKAEEPAATEQKTEEPAAETTETGNGYVSEQTAKDNAVSYLGLGIPDVVTAEFVNDGTPMYVVTVSFGTETHIVYIDALTGNALENQGQAESEYISEDDAKSNAISYLGLGIPEVVTAEFVNDGTPMYVVTISFGTETHIVNVDALTGSIIE